MRKNLRLLFCLVALGLAFVPAQVGVARQNVPMVGTFREAPTNNAQVVAATRYAVKTQAEKQKTTMKLVSVHKAERQTTQGAVYRLCLVVEIEYPENNVRVDEGVRVLVYQNLKGQYTLGKWTVDNCNEDDEGR